MCLPCLDIGDHYDNFDSNILDEIIDETMDEMVAHENRKSIISDGELSDDFFDSFQSETDEPLRGRDNGR